MEIIYATLPTCQGCFRVPDYTCKLQVSDEWPRHRLIFEQTPAPDTLLQIGVHQLTIRVTDPNGNVSTCSTQIVVQCQTTYLSTAQTASCPEGEVGNSVTKAAGTYSSTVSQAAANAAALAAAQAELECFECVQFSGPLNSAVYSPDHDAIFAVNSSGRIMKLNATTGQKISESRFFVPDWGDSYITYLGGFLWVTNWMTFGAQNATYTSPNPPDDDGNNKFLFKINPATLAVSARYDYELTSVLGSSDILAFEGAPRQLITDGTYIYGLFHRSSSNVLPYRFDPSTGLFVTFAGTNNLEYGWSSLVYDPDLNRIWVVYFNGATPFVPTTMSSGGNLSLSASMVPRGLAYRSSYLYFTVAKGGGALPQHILKKKTDGTGAITTIDTGRINALPFNIRYRSSNDRLYVPMWRDDTVAIINPTTDTVESIKTGFDSPFDVVFTPTKVFAVQHAPQGLKEVV